MKPSRTFYILSILPSLFMGAAGYSSGAPTGACTGMTPGHYPNSPQSSQAPYTITINATSYSPNDVVRVTISGSGTSFKGTIIQARKTGSTTPTGQFSLTSGDTQLKTITCRANSDAVTHSGSATKSTKTVFWTVPSGLTGEVKFYGTFVQSYSTYWLNIQSAALNKRPDPTTTTSSTTTTTTTTTTTNAPTAPPTSPASSLPSSLPTSPPSSPPTSPPTSVNAGSSSSAPAGSSSMMDSISPMGTTLGGPASDAIIVF